MAPNGFACFAFQNSYLIMANKYHSRIQIIEISTQLWHVKSPKSMNGSVINENCRGGACERLRRSWLGGQSSPLLRQERACGPLCGPPRLIPSQFVIKLIVSGGRGPHYWPYHGPHYPRTSISGSSSHLVSTGQKAFAVKSLQRALDQLQRMPFVDATKVSSWPYSS